MKYQAQVLEEVLFFSVNGKNIKVGPESVGAVPGPASFGRGGKESTMTDVNLLMGLLDPQTFFWRT